METKSNKAIIEAMKGGNTEQLEAEEQAEVFVLEHFLTYIGSPEQKAEEREEARELLGGIFGNMTPQAGLISIYNAYRNGFYKGAETMDILAETEGAG